LAAVSQEPFNAPAARTPALDPAGAGDWAAAVETLRMLSQSEAASKQDKAARPDERLLDRLAACRTGVLR